MMSLVADATRRNPYPLYEQMRKATPVFQDPTTGMWMLFDHESVKRALSDHDTFSNIIQSSEGRVPDWLIFSDPPRHTRLRALIIRAFTPRCVAALEPRIKEFSRQLLDSNVDRGQMDLVTEYADLLPAMVICELLGLPQEDRPLLLEWSDALLRLSHVLHGGPAAQRTREEFVLTEAAMRRYVDEAIAVRRSAGGDDLLAGLVEAEVDGERLDNQDILSFFALLLLAGTETIANTISNSVLCLMEHPDQLAQLKLQPSILPQAIEEVLRYRSPTQFVFRIARTPVRMGVHLIPANAIVMPVIGSANRDPKVFANPDRFDIRRQPNPHIAFGHGIHFCVGAALSRVQAKIALSDLLSRFETIELGVQTWEPRTGLLVHGPQKLPISFSRS